MTTSSSEHQVFSQADETGLRPTTSKTGIVVNPANRMKFGFIYDSTNEHITAQYLREAMPEDRRVELDLNFARSDADIDQLLRLAIQHEEFPNLLLRADSGLGLPRGLNTVPIPTACLDIDTFGWTEFRLKWAMLFDYVFTWHISYIRLFRAAGHPRVFALPHAVDATLFEADDVARERQYDVGFRGLQASQDGRQREPRRVSLGCEHALL